MATNKTGKYICPMRDEGEKTYPEPGKCPVFGMKLVPYEDKDKDGEDIAHGRQ